jgi:iron complex transport system permease protein
MKLRYGFVLLLALSAVSLFVGVKNISPLDLFRLTEEQARILVVSRLPRLVSLILAGASMGIVGLMMQQLSRNRFVSPTTAGTEDSARLGILTAMLVFGSATIMQKMLIAFAFALAGTLLFMRLLDRIKYKNAAFIPLVGMMLGGVINSVTTFFAYKHNLVQSIGAWLYGDFSMAVQGRYELLYISVPLVALTYWFADRFTIAGMGEDFAASLGLNYRQTVNIGLVIAALNTTVILLTVGVIPFLGLIVPNLVTLYRGDRLRSNLPHTALTGALFVMACDILGRVILYPYEISIGLTVGVIGSGLFLYLLARRNAYER